MRLEHMNNVTDVRPLRQIGVDAHQCDQKDTLQVLWRRYLGDPRVQQMCNLLICNHGLHPVNQIYLKVTTLIYKCSGGRV